MSIDIEINEWTLECTNDDVEYWIDSAFNNRMLITLNDGLRTMAKYGHTKFIRYRLRNTTTGETIPEEIFG